MREMIKHIRNYIMLVVVSAIIGLLLLIGAYMIPNERGSLVYQHVSESVETLSMFVENPVLLGEYQNTHLDYYTDGLMLNECIYDEEGSLIEKALLVPDYNISDGGWPQALINYITMDENTWGGVFRKLC